MKTQILLLVLIFPALSYCQEYEHPKHAIAVNYEALLFSGSPYLAGMSIQGLKYDYIFGNSDRKAMPYISSGFQMMRYDGASYWAIPAELCIGTSRKIVSFHIGAGGILHTGGNYLQPAILFTLHAKLRIKFGKLPMFIDLEARTLNSYVYEYQNGGSQGPVQRNGSAFSQGVGLSIGAYLD